MLKEQLLNYCSIQSAIFLKKFALATKTADIDAIHDMRVSLKRLSSLIRMLNYADSSNFRLRRCFKPLKQIFKKSGPVREFQVQTVLIENFKKVFYIDDNLSAIILKTKNELVGEYLIIAKTFNLISAKRTFKLIKRYIENQSEEKIAEKLADFEKSRFVYIELFSNIENSVIDLHSARKMIKDLAYIAEMLGTEKKNQEASLIKYRETGRVLGEWHDMFVLYNFLSQLKKENKAGLYPEFKILDIKVKEETQSLKKKYYELYESW